MTVDPNKVKSIFLAAMEECSPDEWDSFLEQACAEDVDLRGRVKLLLQAHLGKDSLFDASKPASQPTIYQPITEGHGTVVGPYKLLQQIGEGGMGAVYMAEQTEPVRRRVALKIIKPGMDTRQVIARFEAERQALAMMDHPNIAKVLDAGATETGRPYFVMELVKGVPIGEYCDMEGLSTRERLKLYVQVCRAVQHAHQKGVIHRDIKPSNVMVTLHDGRPVPKVIDFGIAKATNARLTEKTLFTEYRQLVGTPEYMSPEQAEMSDLDVDTRSDIYSLGVLLYELLTGTTPFESGHLRRAGYGELQRIIREEEPPKPSARLSSMVTVHLRASKAADRNGETSVDGTSCLSNIARNRRTDPSSLARSLRGDLDWIVMKALEKDRNRRYETANELARDIERHLSDDPVLASPPSPGYRLSKLIRRNRGTFVAASLVFVVLVLGIFGTSLGLVRAVKAERLAQEKASIAEAVNDFLNNDLLAAVAPSLEEGRDTDVGMHEVLSVAAERIEEASRPGGRFAEKPLVEASIRKTLSETFRLLGDYREAEPHAKRAVELCCRVLGDEHPDSLQAMKGLATVFYWDGRYAEAESLQLDTLQTETRVLGEEHPQTLGSMCSLAAVYCGQGRFDDAEPLIVKAVGNPESIQVLDEYARLQLTREPSELRDPKAALLMAMKVNELTDHGNPRYLETLALAYHLAGQPQPAVEFQKKAVTLLAEDESPLRIRMEARLTEFEAMLEDSH